jgi:4-amino-4-deoxy-L-arabinose transferase-like glycosyltransferase
MRLGRPVPRPLGLLLGAVALLGVAWALLVPPWQSPDETAHFGYTQVLAERFRLPGTSPGRLYSTEQELAMERANTAQTFAVPATRPEWSERAYRGWRSADERLGSGAREDGGGQTPGGLANSARTNPPLYYAYESAPYLAASAGDVFDRLYLMRLWSLLLLLITVAATWLVIGEVVGVRPLLQLAGAGVAGLEPMASFISASVNPDALLMATWAVALWLGARILRRGLKPRPGLALGAVTALAIVTKASGWALVPAAALVLGIGAWRRRGLGLRALAMPAPGALAFALLAGGWLVLARVVDRPALNDAPGGGAAGSGFDVGRFASYLWQYYLPNLPSQERFTGLSPRPVFDTWIKTGWGAFGWLEVRFPDPVYVVLAVLTALLVGGMVAALVRRRPTGGLALLGFFGLAAVGLLGGLHWAEYRVLTSQGTNFNQGRYLLPLLPLLGVGAAGALESLPARVRPAGAGLLLGGLFVLQLFSLAIVSTRFYA